MVGIDPVNQRPMMQESLEAILALFRAGPGERISRETNSFTLRDAALHMRPYTWPYPEIACAAMVSPSGPHLARVARHLAALAVDVGAQQLRRSGDHLGPRRRTGRQVGSRRTPTARTGVCSASSTWQTPRTRPSTAGTYGLPQLPQLLRCGQFGTARRIQDQGRAETFLEFVEDYASKGNCCIGTPAEAITYIQDLLDRSGGFGTFLLLGHDWASPAATHHSHELFAREVMPHFKGQLGAPRESHEWAKGHPGSAVRPRRARRWSMRSPNTSTNRRTCKRISRFYA